MRAAKGEFEKRAENGTVTGQSAKLREIVDRMLAMVYPFAFTVDGRGGRFTVTLSGISVAFEPSFQPPDTSLERLAAAIEARIAFERASAMLAAAGNDGGLLPLWLVTGSSVLAAWLDWSRSGTVFRRRLALSDAPGLAPVAGVLDRPMRRSLGQPAAKIRVRSGLAIADRIELPARVPCTATFAPAARIRIEGGTVPETVVAAFARDRERNGPVRAADVIDHLFLAAADLKLAGIRNEGDTAVLEIESVWGPLAAVPPAAWAVLPRDADLSCPWRPTLSEITALYTLVDAGRAHRRSA